MVRKISFIYLLWQDVQLSAKVQSLLKSVSHGSHLIFFCGVYFHLLLCEIAQFRILLFQSDFFLLSRTLIEQIGLKEPFEFHNDEW